MEHRPAGELLPGISLLEIYRVEQTDPYTIAPILATYQRPICGYVEICVHETKSRIWSAGYSLGTQLARRVFAAEDIVDNARVELNIPGASQAPALHAIKITAWDTAPNRAPTVWMSRGPERIGGHVACYFESLPQGDWGLRASLSYWNLCAETSVPPGILYSPVTQCNLNCIHCISRFSRNKLSHLSDAVKVRIKELCSEGKITSLATDYSGDILWAEHRFGGELDYIFSLDIPFHIDTNGAYLTEDVCERMVRSKLRSINISLDAADPETYRRVRKGAPPLAAVLENIRTLVRVQRREHTDFAISVSFTLMASTLCELPQFVRNAADIGVQHVYARHLEAYTADMESDSLWHDQARFNRARTEAFELGEMLGVHVHIPSPFTGLPVRRGHMPCQEPWRSAVILGNGDVMACCVPGTKMGNLGEQSLEQIWNGERYRTFRSAVNSDHPPWPCSACPIFRLPENKDSYLLHSAKQTELHRLRPSLR